jgi:hypothetical protein
MRNASVKHQLADQELLASEGVSLTYYSHCVAYTSPGPSLAVLRLAYTALGLRDLIFAVVYPPPLPSTLFL